MRYLVTTEADGRHKQGRADTRSVFQKDDTRTTTADRLAAQTAFDKPGSTSWGLRPRCGKLNNSGPRTKLRCSQRGRPLDRHGLFL